MAKLGTLRLKQQAEAGATLTVRDPFGAVTDDGDPSVRGSSGYGLIGMNERASLLGGTFWAGPAPNRGWIIEATLPRAGVPT
jgi:signal transduction histidine kinase